MAKAANIKIKLLSTADTGFFYVTSKNSRTKTDKLSFRKYDPVANQVSCLKSKRRPCGRRFGFKASKSPNFPMLGAESRCLFERGPAGFGSGTRRPLCASADRPTPRTQEMRRT
jgi:large subunit ribosomal protein L33